MLPGTVVSSIYKHFTEKKIFKKGKIFAVTVSSVLLLSRYLVSGFDFSASQRYSTDSGTCGLTKGSSSPVERLNGTR